MKRLLFAVLPALALGGCDRSDHDDPIPPAAPTGLLASAASNAEIDLSWTDNASDEERFFVEQSSDGTAFVQVADLPADATAASIAGLAPSTTYYFRVRAYGSRAASAWSNTAGATTMSVGWTLLTPAGTPPEARSDHAAICQPGLRMIVFGGSGAAPYNDAWSLDLSMPPVAWTDVTPASSPPERMMHASAYDAPNQRMIVFGGYDSNFPDNNEVLALDLSGTPAWSQLLSPDPSPATPASRISHSLIYDSVNQRMILFGGNDGGGAGLNDVWALSLTGTPVWIKITTVGTPPSPRYSHSAVYDAAGQRMIVFGGNDGSPYANDTWALGLSGAPIWTRLGPSGVPPSARYGHSAIYDAIHARMFVFGGDDGSLKNDLWVLTLSGPLEWHPVFAAGALPSARLGHSAVYNPGLQEAILFGGWDNTGTVNNEAWSLGL